MSEDNIRNVFSVEALRKVARIVDFVVYLIRTVNEHVARLCDNLKSLPNAFTTLGVAEIVDDAMDSMRAAAGLIVNIMPSSKICGEEKSQEFWDLHTALIVYHYDASMLLKHSLLSAFTGYYSVASTELRNAMESVVRGVIFDLLAIPECRRNAKELQKIKGFGGKPSFPELLDLLEKKLGDKRSKVSVEIFDMIDKELRGFNPEAAFIKLLLQLKEWNVIDDKLVGDINSFYEELSKLAHRIHPKFSEVGIRVKARKDWLDLEPVPEELFIYLNHFLELNGLFTYLALKVFSLDLIHKDFRGSIDWSELDKYVQLASKLAKAYPFWEKVINVLEELKT